MFFLLASILIIVNNWNIVENSRWFLIIFDSKSIASLSYLEVKIFIFRI